MHIVALKELEVLEVVVLVDNQELMLQTELIILVEVAVEMVVL